jgi:hypothetical protein
VYKDDKDDKDAKLVQSDHWYDDDEYFETEILFDALYDAQAGYYDDIINLIAECVYPEDPVFAIKFLSKRKLTDDLLEEAKQWPEPTTHRLCCAHCSMRFTVKHEVGT